MFVAIDNEGASAFGPFDSNNDALEWVHERLLENGTIAPEDEAAAAARTNNDLDFHMQLQQDLMNLGWFIYEVEFVESWPPEAAE